MTISVIRLWLDSYPWFSWPTHSDSIHLSQSRVKFDSRLMSRAQPWVGVSVGLGYMGLRYEVGVWYGMVCNSGTEFRHDDKVRQWKRIYLVSSPAVHPADQDGLTLLCKDSAKATNTGGSRRQPGHAPQKSRNHVFFPQKLPKKLVFLFSFGSEFGSIPKNSGLNPWSFQFWGYPRLGPRPKLPPPKTGGWIRQWLPTFQIVAHK